MSNAKVDNGATSLLVELTNFNGASSDKLGSYLRLGAVPSNIVDCYDTLNNSGVDNDTSALTTASGEDLASQVMGFVDDTRYRGEDNSSSYFTMTTAERQEESKLLHTKGGWRDHTDGNRVTTTDGDKVEVIGGNYKMIVLGRKQWNPGSGGVGLHNESSGGITYHYDEVPGQIIDVRRSKKDDTWEVIEECQKGHFVARYHGVDKDWHQGGDLVTRIGHRGAYRVYKGGVTWASVKSDHGFSTDSDFDKPSNASHLANDFWPGDNTLPEVREEIFALTVIDRVDTGTGDILNEDGTKTYMAESHTTKLYATSIEDFQTFITYKQTMEGEDKLAQATESWEGIFFELFIACAFTWKMGAFWDLRFGFLCSMVNVAGLLTQINITAKRTQVTLATLYIDKNMAPLSFKARVAASAYELGASKKNFEMAKKTYNLMKYIN